MPGLSPEPRCVDNRGISRRNQTRIAITACDLTNCARSEPFVASLCGGLWSAFTPKGQGPTSYCPEIATAPAGSSRPASHLWGYSARRVSDARLRRAVTRAKRVRPLVWHQAPACPPHVWANGYRSAKQQAYRTPANARLALFANPLTPFTARIRRAPSPRPRLEIATVPATFARPGPSPRQGGRARPVGATSSRDLGAPDEHATPPRSRSRAPAASRPPRLSQGPIVASPPENCHSTIRFHQTRCPALGRAPARGPWGSIIAGPRGASRPPARTHAVGPGTGKSWGGPYALATPPWSRSRAPTSLMAFAPPQSGAHGPL